MPQEYKSYRVPLKRSDGSLLVSDMYHAVFLSARGNCIRDLEESPQPGRFAFVFEAADDIERDIAAWNANAAIPIRDFLDALYLVKNLLRNHAPR